MNGEEVFNYLSKLSEEERVKLVYFDWYNLGIVQMIIDEWKKDNAKNENAQKLADSIDDEGKMELLDAAMENMSIEDWHADVKQEVHDALYARLWAQDEDSDNG